MIKANALINVAFFLLTLMHKNLIYLFERSVFRFRNQKKLYFYYTEPLKLSLP